MNKKEQLNRLSDFDWKYQDHRTEQMLSWLIKPSEYIQKQDAWRLKFKSMLVKILDSKEEEWN